MRVRLAVPIALLLLGLVNTRCTSAGDATSKSHAPDVFQAQQPIRVDVNLVNVAFTARDARGALVNNLTKDDIDLFEDAAPQKIEFFAKSTDLPLTLALIVDVSGSQEHFGKKHEKDLEIFLKEMLGPKDRAFVICFGNHLRLISDYTNSADQILQDLKDFDKGKKH
ncbi:MAG TPA: VWA domain-containing protein, partial [Candidatus Acidoferrum sp.]